MTLFSGSRLSNSLAISILTVALGSPTSVALAHDWGRGAYGYHWNVYGDEVPITLNNQCTGKFIDLADAAISDWDRKTLLALSESGRDYDIRVISDNAGPTLWAGIAGIESLESRLRGHIGAAYAQVNSYYGEEYSNIFLQGILCQEIGHTFGLDHSDTGDCMGLGYYSATTFFVGDHNAEDLEVKYGSNHHDRFGGSRATFSAEAREVVEIFWVHQPVTLEEAYRLADAVVVATVTSVDRGADIHTTTADGDPGSMIIPTLRVGLDVEQTILGESLAELSVVQTGSESWLVHDDPRYEVGETYLLFLAAREDGSFMTISPEGRYLVQDGRLAPVTQRGFSPSLKGAPLAAATR